MFQLKNTLSTKFQSIIILQKIQTLLIKPEANSSAVANRQSL